jgi:hypothetical protein
MGDDSSKKKDRPGEDPPEEKVKAKKPRDRQTFAGHDTEVKK